MRRALAVAASTAVALVARSHLKVRDARAKVDPELRSPLLPFVATSFSDRKLRVVRWMFGIPMRPGPGVSMTTCHVGDPSVPVLVFTPEQRSIPAPGVLWLHGGGYVVGTPAFEAAGSGSLARDLGAVVVSPDYRLAPENPFPAGLDDCMTALRWMRGPRGRAGYRRRPDRGDRGQCGWGNGGRGRPPRIADAPEYASPARRSDLSGLAPAWVGVGELDVFYDEDVAYAERLKSCGVPCELVTVPGMYHGADGIRPKAQSMRDFRASMMDYLASHL